ncbi:hypothetical protein B0H10DRAFT_2043999 [Mycena sp. CBHHK59/15]|nr:hypothetical protein B0H10DRAFT_2043999 [Mycena sp. CBHHK59/15]
MTETLSDTQIQGQLYISRYLILVPFTILLYDYVLTLDQEVARFWCKGLTWGSFFFYLNRYTSLFGTIPILVEFFLTTTDPSKKAVRFESYHQYFALLSQVMVAIMLIMRTYALYERKKIVLAFTILVTVGAAAFALVMGAVHGVTHDTLSSELRAFGCPSATPHDTYVDSTAAAWSGLLIFDVMIFSLTLYKALTHHARRGDLLTVLIRDGVLMIVSNACNIGTYTPLLSGSATSLTNVVSSVMISRLMLNLRDPGIRLPQRRSRSRATTTADDSPAITTFLRPYLGTEFATTIDSGRVDTAGEQSNGESCSALRMLSSSCRYDEVYELYFVLIEMGVAHRASGFPFAVNHSGPREYNIPPQMHQYGGAFAHIGYY